MGNINIYDTRTMLQAVEMMKPVRTFLKDTFFSTPRTFLTEHVDVDYKKGRRKMAPFVSPRVAGKVMDRDGFKTETFKPATIKPMRTIEAYDLKNRSFGEGIYSTRSESERAAEMLAADLSELDEAITRREEFMAAQVLFTGKVHIIGDGVDQEVDFNFTNKETLSGTDMWSDQSASDPMADLKRWRLAVIKSSGVNPDSIIMSSDVVTAFVSHPKVKDSLDNRRVMLGQIDPRTMPNGVTYIGSLSELGVEIYSYDEWYFDEEAKVEKPMVPEGSLMIGSTNARSSMLYGSVTLTDQLTTNFMTFEGSRVPDSWIMKDPAARFLQMHAKPLPVPHEVDSWYVAKVK